MSLKNHKKTHKNYYQVEDETDTSFKDKNTDSDISKESEVISRQDNNLTTNKSNSRFDDQKTTNESDSISDDQETTSESDLMLDNQKTNNEYDLIFDSQVTTSESNSISVDEYVSIFDKQEIIENINSFNQTFEKNVLDNYEETIDEVWSEDSEHDDRNFPDVLYRNFVDI
ncbi:2175_t:CDS:2 [Gigaspora margarita]|uniref:2175_t:CDS:1 n=1 Tax=Gigaspora margarita TaxID=4874 RepID=A0ABN7UIJ0_GIGMA|nr:2175_t:CDS:2 [Gigaspora margarita]